MAIDIGKVVRDTGNLFAQNKVNVLIVALDDETEKVPTSTTMRPDALGWTLGILYARYLNDLSGDELKTFMQSFQDGRTEVEKYAGKTL